MKQKEKLITYHKLVIRNLSIRCIVINIYRIKEHDFIKNLLVVEDDKTLSDGISLALKNNELMISSAYDIKTAKELFFVKKFDLVILDINLPDGNGMDFLVYIKNNYNVDVIILTANDLEIDIVTGLELGADDYITKPFSLAVLRARVNARLRDSHKKVNDIYNFKNLTFDFNKMEYTKNSVFIEFSKTEQKLLKTLIANKGNIVTRESLINKVWNDDDFIDENALSVAIKRLRDKIEDNPKKPVFIKTSYGIGYIWDCKRDIN